ncbi:MAG TPA: ATPase [Lachnoclostridium phytofermentans]|uniref:ATP synthase F(0) sector subunit c n=1 Tax=Lachnoclostridium phytofermentans TaxID=66219 RepID=A0A3D2X6D2_9FIRM|nr:ATP synthase subunit C [Lachnoclostridium sp.]HCL02115.1 ATPase [Lachnoclostridium phytofermentans]
MYTNYIIAGVLVLNFFLPIGYMLFKKQKQQKTTKWVLGSQIFVFFATVVVGSLLMFHSASSTVAMAAATEAAAGAAPVANDGLRFIAAALSTGMSTIGAGIAVASAASAALGALSEDSKIMGKALIFVALAEGVALYGMLISFMILNA